VSGGARGVARALSASFEVSVIFGVFLQFRERALRGVPGGFPGRAMTKGANHAWVAGPGWARLPRLLEALAKIAGLPHRDRNRFLGSGYHKKPTGREHAVRTCSVRMYGSHFPNFKHAKNSCGSSSNAYQRVRSWVGPVKDMVWAASDRQLESGAPAPSLAARAPSSPVLSLRFWPAPRGDMDGQMAIQRARSARRAERVAEQAGVAGEAPPWNLFLNIP
jgi:hypothetical protein